MARLIGEAYIAIVADGSLLRTSADEQVRRALAGLRPAVKITGDTTDIDKKVAALAAALKGLNGNVDLNTHDALVDIGALGSELEALRERAENIPLDMNDSRALAKLFTLFASIDTLSKQAEKMSADFNINRAIAKFYTMEAGVKALEEAAGNMRADFDEAAATGKLLELGNGIAKLAAELNGMRAGVDSSAALAKIVALQAAALKLANSLKNLPVTADTLPLEASMFKLAAQVEALKKTLGISIPVDLSKLSLAEQLLARINQTQSFIISSGTGGWGILNNQIRLFGGALESFLPNWLADVHLWHLFTDVIFEFAAAWIPALIAVGTFAAYAFPVGEKLFGQWKNINTVIDGVGGNIHDLGTSFDTIEKAIEPSILEAFGEYMQVLGNNAAPLGAALTKVGNVIDVWGASLVGWFASAEKSFDGFVSTGAKDFAMIGYGFQELTKILGDIFIHDMPGYVHILLYLGDAFLTATADAVQFLGPVLKVALALHGFIVYVGLAVTALLAISRALVAGALTSYIARTGGVLATAGEDAEASTGKFSALFMGIGSFAGTLAAGVRNLFKYSGAVVDLGKSEGIAKAGSKLLADGLSLIPFGPIGLAAAAAAAVIGVVLYFALRNTTDAADKFGAKMQDLITASNAANIGQNITTALARTSAQYTKLTQQLSAPLKPVALSGKSSINTSGTPLNNNLQQQQQYLSQLGTIVTETDNYGQRLNTLSHIFGSTAGAQAALTLAGISAGKVATENNQAWATTLIELKGLALGYGYMGSQAGAAGAQLNALNISTGTVTKNVQALTQAESAWVTMITSGDSAFTSFEQGQSTITQALGKSANSSQNLQFHLGSLSEKIPEYGAKMFGLSNASLAATQAFISQLGAATTLYGNLQMLATASGNTSAAQKELAVAGKAIIAQMLPFAAGSKEGTAELSALAQLMGGPATDSFQALAKWVGNTKNATGKLNDAQAKLTISAANLTTAEKNLGNVLDTQITAAQAAAIAKTTNLTNVTQALANVAVAAKGKITDQAILLSGQYLNSLEKSGVGVTTATQYLNAYLKQLGYGNTAISIIDKALTENETSFENTAKQLGITKQAADDLWTSLHKLSAGSPYAAHVTDSIAGSGVITAKATMPGGSQWLARLVLAPGAASGWQVPAGGTPAGRDGHLAMLAPGELVIPTSHAAQFGAQAKAAGIPGLAGGGFVGTAQSQAATFSGTPDWDSAVAGKFAGTAVQSFVNAAKQSVVSQLNTFAGSGGISGNVGSYAKDVIQVLKMLNLPLSYEPTVLAQMTTESGGQPAIVNKTDSNWLAGHPSVGLMQVIAGTFDAYAGPYRNIGPFEYGVSINPMANIYAGVNYAAHAYPGKFTSVLGHGHGYSAGGMINEPVFGTGAYSGLPYSFAEHGPEQIIPGGAATAPSPMMQPMTTYQGQHLLSTMNMMVKLLQQMPYAFAGGVSQGTGNGVRHGYYGAQN